MKMSVNAIMAAALLVAAVPAGADNAVVLLSSYGTNTYESVLSADQFKEIPTWNPKKDPNPPCPPAKALGNAEETLRRVIPKDEFETQWTLHGIFLAHVVDATINVEKWYYVVVWRGPRLGFFPTSDGKLAAGRGSRDSRGLPNSLAEVCHEFRLIVLMNGECITPKQIQRPAKKAPEPPR